MRCCGSKIRCLFWPMDPGYETDFSRVFLRSKLWSFRGSKWSRGGPCMLTIKAWSLKMEPLRVCKPVSQICITSMRSGIRIRIQAKSWTRIRIEVKSWIRIRIEWYGSASLSRNYRKWMRIWITSTVLQNQNTDDQCSGSPGSVTLTNGSGSYSGSDFFLQGPQEHCLQSYKIFC